MNIQIKKGLLEYCVLAELCRGESYGYQMIRDISEWIEISESTLYPILKRLEAEQFVKTRNVEHNNRIRRYFQLTEKGSEHLTDFMSEQTELLRIIEFITSAPVSGQAGRQSGKEEITDVPAK